MRTVKELLDSGCFFCKAALTLETACVATLSFALVQDRPKEQWHWSEPMLIASCPACFQKYSQQFQDQG
jgi:hypothetical protein